MQTQVIHDKNQNKSYGIIIDTFESGLNKGAIIFYHEYSNDDTKAANTDLEHTIVTGSIDEVTRGVNHFIVSKFGQSANFSYPSESFHIVKVEMLHDYKYSLTDNCIAQLEGKLKDFERRQLSLSKKDIRTLSESGYYTEIKLLEMIASCLAGVSSWEVLNELGYNTISVNNCIVKMQ